MNVLFSSAGRRKYLLDYFKALPEVSKVIATNSIDTPVASLAADRFYRIPYIYEEHHLETLLDVCKKEEIDLLFCLHDVESIIISQHIEKFLAINVFPVVSDFRFLDICIDKFKTYEFLIQNGLKTPATVLSGKGYKGQHSFPLMVKPRYGFGSQHIFEIHKEAELGPISDYVKDRIDFKLFEKLNWDAGSPVIVQEKINGIEHGLQILNDFEGNYIGSVQIQKLEMMCGETYGATIVFDPLLEKVARRISEISGHIGILDIDLFKTREDEFLILEMNPRFGGQFPFAHLGGSNVLDCIVKLYKKMECDHFQPAAVGQSFKKNLAVIKTS